MGDRQRIVRSFTPIIACLVASGVFSSCAWLPSEFNLSPIYRHRLDRDGSVLEMDVLWPIVHFETMTNGGSDFRIRPFYRRVEQPDTPGFAEPADLAEPPAPAPARGRQQDHQFLWPLGRIRQRENETHARLFPIWSHDSRTLVDGRIDTDWYCLFPLLWGGSDQASAAAEPERYFGVFPLYLDAPGEFLTYDRFKTVLWPLYLRTEKDGRIGDTFLWPLISIGHSADPKQTYWHRFLPFYNRIVKPGVFQRTSLLWPLLTWSTELIDSGDPLTGFQLWPLFGRQTSRRRSSWHFLWPLFRGQQIQGRKWQLDLFWPLFHWLEDDTDQRDIHTWWFWPFVSHTTAKHQDSWSFLWPLIWWRHFDDPDGVQTQRWILPFFRHVHRSWKTGDRPWQPGGEDDYLQIWPLFHRESKRDGTGEFAFPSPWPWRDGNAEGVGEAYDWLYTVFRSRDRSPDDHATELTANLYTARSRGDRTQRSVPFLFSYEADGAASTFYLFNLIPIRFGDHPEGPR